MRKAAMKKFATIVTVFTILLFVQFSVYAQSTVHIGYHDIAPIFAENYDYDNGWTAVQISLLIAFFYVLYWLKEGAFD
jgi:hypothetical protein